MQIIYTLFIYPVLLLGFHIISFFNPKIRQGLSLRKNKSWLIENELKDIFWFHVASGELEYAKPVIRELKSRENFKGKILVTYFSPSVLPSLAKTPEIDLFVPMPWDTPWAWKEFLKHYKPKVLAIARTDTWPNMVWESKKAKIPSLLFSATLPKNSGRVASFWGRLFYGLIMEDLTQISAVTEDDRQNFLRISEDLNVTVDGDTRFDQVIKRVGEHRPLPLWLSEISGSILVAGSTWPEDEKELIPAVIKALKEKKFTILMAPHEPTEKHLKPIEDTFKRAGVSTIRFSKVHGPPREAIILIDQVGILADLYRLGKWAFIGGSFRKSVHSVMESAASGVYTFFGPLYKNNREAIHLIEKRLAQSVSSSEEIQRLLLKELSSSQDEISQRQKNILVLVNENKGVSSKIADLIISLSL
jgi:3-deoxy-D-manno-octulosonic-acid transferase